jgi:2-polyprenyl-3-methyl-5-hydroxy-6-metoxy-1,4-benzoquinol methylase
MPVLSASELAGFYRRDYASHEVASRGILARLAGAAKRMQMRAVLRAAPFSAALGRQPGRALDVGCGRGDLAGALHARGWRVAGIEPSERAAAAAALRGVEIVGSTLDGATLRDGGYDLVVLRHSLEHVPDPLADLRRVRSALTPGGSVVISLPNFASWQRARFAPDWFHLDLPRHRVHFTAAALATALQGAGLAVRAQSTSTSALGLPASVQYALVHRCLARSGVRFRLGAAVCFALLPLTRLIDRAGGELDTLHVVASRD